MKFAVILGFIGCLMSVRSSAQNPQEGTVRFNKADRNGVVANYSSSKTTTEQTVVNKLAVAGIMKKSRKKGFWIYKEVSWPAITPETVDVYVKVGGNKKRSSVALLVAKGYDNFISSASDAAAMNNMKEFLNGLPQDISAYSADLALKAQEKRVAAAKEEYERSLRKTNEAQKQQQEEDKAKASRLKKLEEEQNKLQQMKTP